MSDRYHGFQDFPKWLYHGDGVTSRIVQDAAEESRLGPWWFDSPASAQSAVAVAMAEVLESLQAATPIEAPSPRPEPAPEPELVPVPVRRRGRPKKAAEAVVAG